MTNPTLKGTTLVLPPVVDKTSVAKLTGEVLALGKKKAVTSIDLSKIEHFDAAGLEFLAATKVTFPDASLAAPSDAVQKCATTLGASSLFEVRP